MRDHTIFISYSRTDKPWVDRLAASLSSGLEDRRFVVWTDQEIPAGTDYRVEIQRRIQTAEIIVVLASERYFNSEFILDHEFPEVLKAEDKKNADLIWIAVEGNHYKATRLKHLQAANNPDKPLNSLSAEEGEQAIENISSAVIKAADERGRRKSPFYYVNFIPFGLIATPVIFILLNYVNEKIRLTLPQLVALLTAFGGGLVWIVGLALCAHAAFKRNRPLPAPRRLWAYVFDKLEPKVGERQRDLTPPRVLVVCDQQTLDSFDDIKSRYEGENLLIDRFVCPDDFSTYDLAAILREVDGLYVLCTDEIENNKRFRSILNRWEQKETHKPIMFVDLLNGQYRLPYTRIPPALAVQGFVRVLAHGASRAYIWRRQARNYRMISWATLLVAVAVGATVYLSWSKVESYRLFQNVYQVIARRTRDDIATQLHVQDPSLNVSYWFRYRDRLYQLGTTEIDSEQDRSYFEADQSLDPSLIGCVFQNPNHSAQWSEKSSNIAIVGRNGKPDPITTCQYKNLPNKPFKSMVCTSYAPSGSVPVGICAFTFQDKYDVTNEALNESLSLKAEDFYTSVSGLIKEEKLIPQQYRDRTRH